MLARAPCRVSGMAIATWGPGPPGPLASEEHPLTLCAIPAFSRGGWDLPQLLLCHVRVIEMSRQA